MFKSFAVTLAALLAASPTPSATQQTKITPVARLELGSPSDAFGGLSGFEIDAQGDHFWSISDTGVLFQGRLLRDSETRQLTGAEITSETLLQMDSPTPRSEKALRDTEGLALAPNARLLVTTETVNRLLSFAAPGARPDRSDLPDVGTNLSNRGFEALAVSQTGGIYVLPETSGSLRTPFPLLKRSTDQTWETVFEVPRSGNFRPVGADFGPDGNLYLLLRSFNGIAFASRIARIRFSDETPMAYELLYASRYGQFDNLEGLAVWQVGPEDLRITAVSDNNFSPLQSTHIIEFSLKE